MLAITLEGGLVSAVLTDNPALRKEECIVVDYDAEGCEDAVTDKNGDPCCPSRHKIVRLSKTAARALVKLTDEREQAGQ